MKTLLSLALVAAIGIAHADDKVVNVYSSRHYQSDEALYADFTKTTGIRVNRIEAGEDALIERIRNEGAHSPADILIITDAGRLWRAAQFGLFQTVHSATLDARIPANFRDPAGQWYGFSLRARVIVYNKTKVKPEEIPTYESLADPKWKGRICVRSGTHVYNLSLLASLIEHLGKAKAEAWAKAVKANLARAPKGGDTDQLRGVAAGECDVALANHYYYVRLARSTKDADREASSKLGVVFPNQGGRGTHFNVSGAGILKHAPHRASDSAQRYFADGNNEWPVVASVRISNPVLVGFGQVKPDAINVAAFGHNQADAQKLFDSVGWR
jgi:iron(III) transport system substrate-binding protein